MAQTQIFTYDNLVFYDGLLKTHISEEIAKCLKTVAIDGNTLKFYTVEEPVGETAPVFEIELPETDISGLLPKLTNATAGNVVTVAENGKDIVDSGIKAADLALKSEVEAIDGKVDANTEAINAINDETTGILAQAKADATEKANAVQASVDVLDDKVGTVPEGSTVMGIIQNIQENAYDDTELRGLISGLDTNKADKTQVATDIETAVKAEEDARKEAVQAIQDAVGELAGTHTTDKAALEAAIALKADQTALDAVSAVANAATTKTALQEEVNRATGEEARIESLVTAEAERATQAEANLQTQINTIMNNPDAEGAINSINEFTQYVEEHGEIAEAFRVDINANAQAIEDLSAEVAGTYETKEDATAKYDEVKAMVTEKAVQADWSQNDATAPDYIKNRPFGEEVSEVAIIEETTYDFISGYGYGENGECGNYFANQTPLEVGKQYKVVFDGIEYVCTAVLGDVYDDGKGDIYLGNPSYYGLYSDTVYEDNGLPFAIYYGTETWLHVLAPRVYDCEHTFSLYAIEEGSVKQLDEKFIPDTIARVADMDALEGRVEVAESKITELEGAVATKAEAQDLTDAIATLNGTDTELDERLQLVEAQLGDGENSVSDLIDTAKQEAIDVAAQDATTKANDAEQAAKQHATDLNDAMNARVEALEAIDHDHDNKEELDLIETGDKAKWDSAAEKAHEHTNKELLDTYTQTETDLADAVVKKHEHANSAELDKIADGDVAKWNTAEQNAKDHANSLNSAMTTRVDGVAEDVADHEERLAALESVEYVSIPEEDIRALFVKEA